ncbi:MAG: malate synthase A, partial [Actinomycetia bacterium]|nr:malate synthase A [Actinomycetes bacterium]
MYFLDTRKLNTPKHALLDAGCKQFLLALHQKFEPNRQALLAARQQRAEQFDAGDLPDFPAETAPRRADAEWQTTRTPEDLQDRRVEITGPCSRKMVINALNSGAQTFMACLEDATSPHWENVIDGQANLRDAIAKTIA